MRSADRRGHFARLSVLCALVVALLLPAASSAGVSREFYGVQAWGIPSAAEFSRMGQGRVGTFRIVFAWRQVEPTPGARNWTYIDGVVRDAAQAGIRVLPVTLFSPDFAARKPLFPPRSSALKRYTAYLRDLVARYGPGGKFWKENSVRYVPIKSWQIWNEPNLPQYWNDRPSATQYASFLRTSAIAIHSRDRHAKVVTAGVPNSRIRHSIQPEKYLTQLYAVRGIKSYFDAVAIHPYSADTAGLKGALSRTHAVLKRFHDTGTPLWITEIGAASSGPRTGGNKPFVTSPNGQASRLTGFYKLALSTQRAYNVGMVAWFAWRDRAVASGEVDWWAPHTGLFTLNGDAKPSWRAFTRLTHGNAGSGRLPSDPSNSGGGPGGTTGGGAGTCTMVVCLP